MSFRARYSSIFSAEASGRPPLAPPLRTALTLGFDPFDDATAPLRILVAESPMQDWCVSLGLRRLCQGLTLNPVPLLCLASRSWAWSPTSLEHRCRAPAVPLRARPRAACLRRRPPLRPSAALTSVRPSPTLAHSPILQSVVADGFQPFYPQPAGQTARRQTKTLSPSSCRSSTRARRSPVQPSAPVSRGRRFRTARPLPSPLSPRLPARARMTLTNPCAGRSTGPSLPTISRSARTGPVAPTGGTLRRR